MKQETYNFILKSVSEHRKEFRERMLSNDALFSYFVYMVAEWIEEGIIIRHNQEAAKGDLKPGLTATSCNSKIEPPRKSLNKKGVR